MPGQEEQTESELQALIGTTVAGKYRVERMIGRGGMGAVFQATNIGIGKRVALKFLDHESAQNREASRRFQREAEAAGMAESAHIVQIFDSGASENGLPFLVMELLTGEDLRARLRREGRLELAEALRITSQVLRALVRAHEAGIVHRDLKPDNVFLCARDDDPSFVKLVDFGISKVARARMADTLTRKGTVLGTAFYMSPEQAQSFHDIDGRTDLFSVGAILYEMLSGAPPHGGRTYEAVLIAICTHDAPDLRARLPDLPASVAALLAKALERDRARRFQSAAEFLGALSNVERELGLVAGSASAAVSSAHTPRARSASEHVERKRYGTLVAGIVATLAGFALAAYFIARVSTPRSTTAEQPSASVTTRVAPPATSAVVVSPVTSAPNAAPAVTATALPASPQKSHRTPSPKPNTHVAPGLQLSTKEP